jgi:uncharacterized protein
VKRTTPVAQTSWATPSAHEVNWVIKASKLCNLRCRYCYEWDELGNPARMDLPQWEKVLYAIRDYHALLTASLGDATINIIWHGGEPLLLPPSYFESVFELQSRILGRRTSYSNVLQTNLYAVPERTLSVLEDEGVELGFSFDVIRGVRLTAGGRDSEGAVERNARRLMDRGVSLGAIAVLAGHTSAHVREIYDFYKTMNLGVRFLPIFDAPLNTPEASFSLTTDGIVAALSDLFNYWIEDKTRICVYPLADYLHTVLLRLTGKTQDLYDRRGIGEWALMVNTDGSLYHACEAYQPDKCLGNLFQQDIREILASPAYERSLERDAELVRRYCKGCRYLGSCDTLPIFESPRSDVGTRRCSIAYGVYKHIEGYVGRHELSPRRIRAVLDALA